MNNIELEFLRDIAFEITIDPKNSTHAASAEDVVKVLGAYINSYKSYLKIKLEKENTSEERVAEIIKNAELLIVDTDFNSFHSSLAPKEPNYKPTMNAFNGYKKEILETDIDNYSAILELKNSFTKEELHSIYSPIFTVLNSKYSIKVKTESNFEKIVNKPLKDFATYFKPDRKLKNSIKDEDKLYQVFVQTSDLSHISKKDIIFSSELTQETSPYILDRIIYGGKTIYLHSSIMCKVDFLEDLYFISYPDLNIEVWGDSRKEAEEAFDFTFYSLVINYTEEDDSNLTNDAIILKNKLTTMIRLVK